MTVSRIADRRKIDSIKSRLGHSLIRLHQANRVQHQHTEELFDDWKRRWEHRRDQIARRLALIEAQLEELPPSERRPQLAILADEA